MIIRFRPETLVTPERASVTITEYEHIGGECYLSKLGNPFRFDSGMYDSRMEAEAAGRAILVAMSQRIQESLSDVE